MKWFMVAFILFAFGCDKPTETEAGRSNGSNGSTLDEDPVDMAAITEAYQKLLDMDPVKMDPAKVHKWPGLHNFGATCFMNATLKLMAGQKELLDMLKEQTGDDPKIAELRKAFKAVMNMIRMGEDSPAHKLKGFSKHALDALRERMKEAGGTIASLTDCQQHDATEFYNGISSELKLGDQTPNNQLIRLQVAILNNGQFKFARLAEDNAGKVIIFPLTGTTFPVVKDQSTVKNVLDNYTSPEPTTAGNDILAPDNIRYPHLAKYYFLNLDKSLVISIHTTDKKIIVKKNGEATMEKFIRPNLVKSQELITIGHLNGKVPGALALAAINGKAYDKNNKNQHLPANTASKQFNLVGVVVHSGTPDSGHYWSYIKDQNGSWIEHNDSAVTVYKKPGEPLGEIEQKNGTDVNPQVYMYLYEQP